MRLRDALKLHSGDEVLIKGQTVGCKVDCFEVKETSYKRFPQVAYFDLHHPTYGYVRHVAHFDLE